MDPIVALGLFIASVAALAGVAQAYETRRQRLIAQADKEASALGNAVAAGPQVWTCGIYDYPPLSSFPEGPGRPPIGILVDLAKAIFDQWQQPFKFVFFNYEGFYEGEDRIPDLIVGMFDTPDRRAVVSFSRPIHEIALQGLCRIELGGDILADLREGDLRVAVYAGEVGWEFLKHELPDVLDQRRAVIIREGRALDTMKLLEAGAYDVVLMDVVSCLNFLNEGNNRERFKLAFEQPPQTFRACLAVKLMHRDMIEQINSEISRVRNLPWFLEREDRALAGFEKAIAKRALRASGRDAAENVPDHAPNGPNPP